jgi:hypothetical protein
MLDFSILTLWWDDRLGVLCWYDRLVGFAVVLMEA